MCTQRTEKRIRSCSVRGGNPHRHHNAPPVAHCGNSLQTERHPDGLRASFGLKIVRVQRKEDPPDVRAVFLSKEHGKASKIRNCQATSSIGTVAKKECQELLTPHERVD